MSLCLPSARPAGSLSAKPLSHHQPWSFWTLPQADPGDPNEMKVEYDPLSSYSPCPYLYPAVDPPEMGCLSPQLDILIVPSPPTGLWVLEKLRQQLTFILPSVNLFVSPPAVTASSSSRDFPSILSPHCLGRNYGLSWPSLALAV